MTFDDARREFLADLGTQVALGGKSPNTLWTYEKRLEFFGRQTGVSDLGQIDRAVVHNFLLGVSGGTLPDSRKPASQSYVANHWRHLVGFLRWCRRRGYEVDPALFEQDDFTGRTRFSIVEPVVDEADVEPQPWTSEEVDLIRDAAKVGGARDQVAVELLLRTGMRLSEVANLRLDDVQGENIRVARSKSVRGRRMRVTRWVPNYPALSRMLTAWVQRVRPSCPHEFVLCQADGARLTQRGIDSLLDRIHRRAGVGRGGAQRYRDTFATEFLRRNPAQLKKLKDILGHADYRTVERYARKAVGPDLSRPEEDPFA